MVLLVLVSGDDRTRESFPKMDAVDSRVGYVERQPRSPEGQKQAILTKSLHAQATSWRQRQHVPVPVINTFRCKCDSRPNLLRAVHGEGLDVLEVAEQTCPGAFAHFDRASV